MSVFKVLENLDTKPILTSLSSVFITPMALRFHTGPSATTEQKLISSRLLIHVPHFAMPNTASRLETGSGSSVLRVHFVACLPAKEIYSTSYRQ
jgi:hypothetical protein